MKRFRFLSLSLSLIAVVLIGLAGCGGSGASVSGTVTYNGKPVESGHINFYPVDGQGSPVGGPIEGGKYTVKNVPPGKHRVNVTSQPKGAVSADSTDDTIKDKDTKRPDDLIVPTDEGNGQVHEIGTGSVELNLDLKTALSSGGK
jgi:hypothetical protein